ncbi:MAG TPA: chitobiase/beta-hexosaminidase C-terminal domain-containing protein, partial [Opitutaceae bacterium]|nr:chitobiase/beta-hexosaminidase C-terminal domain-containing protein [Opitutaceae bacterium]
MTIPARLSTFVTGLCLALVATSAPAATSPWAQVVNGKLQYQALGNGNHIMDFSTAGYMGGGVALPTVPVQRTLSPSGGDDTSAIQGAINAVAALPLVNGFRGAVLLKAGTFKISSTLNINASGVVLRGSGSGSGGTVLSGSVSPALNIAGSGSYTTSTTTNLSGSYVPSGTLTINVASTSGFSVGDNVLVNRTVTSNWIHFMGMDTLVRGGSPQTWIAAGSVIHTDRTITAISGNTITLDAPLTDSFDATYLGSPVGTISKYTFSGRISQSGAEHLKIQAPKGTTVYSAIALSALIDGWLADVVGQETQNSFTVATSCRRLTLDQVVANNTTAQTNAAAPGSFEITGTQILLNKCEANTSGIWQFLTQVEGTGPIVVLNFSSPDGHGMEPHQRWSTGLLIDNASCPNAYIHLYNRGYDGSGHGWAIGWAVAWNCTAPTFVVEGPPGGTNWCIGCIGSESTATPPGGSSPAPNGTIDSLGTKVTPDSLYLEQLLERLGPQALANIGYGSAPQQAAAPTFSPAAGTYTSAQSVTISTSTGGASIRYTTDGSTPSETAGTLYSGPIGISSTTTLKAIAYESGFTDSPVTSGTYTLNITVSQAAAPSFNPAAGTYASAQNVAITTSTGGASIRYTTDGSAPTESHGTVYSSPVSISSDTTLQAIAYESGFTDSTISSGTYTIGTVGGPITLEAENLSPVGTGATVSISNDANASGGVVEFLNSTAAGQTITFTTPAITAGTYQVQ